MTHCCLKIHYLIFKATFPLQAYIRLQLGCYNFGVLFSRLVCGLGRGRGGRHVALSVSSREAFSAAVVNSHVSNTKCVAKSDYSHGESHLF